MSWESCHGTDAEQEAPPNTALQTQLWVDASPCFWLLCAPFQGCILPAAPLFCPPFRARTLGTPSQVSPRCPGIISGHFGVPALCKVCFGFWYVGLAVCREMTHLQPFPPFLFFIPFFLSLFFFFLKQTCSSLHVYSKKHSSKQISVQHLQIQSSGSSTSRFTATHISTAVVMAIAERFS